MKIKRNGYLDREKLGIHLYVRYMCVCVLCNAILQARKSQKLKCTRLIVVDFSRVFFFFKEYTLRFSISISSILISVNIFLKCSLIYVACSSVIFLKKEN